MGLLRLTVFGPPEVFHDERRLSFALHKAEALLLYLAVEGGMHSRSHLAALLWPDSESSTARNALRNALALLRSLLKAQPPLESRLAASEVEYLYVSLGRAYGFQNAWHRTQETYEELLAYAHEHQLPALVSMTLNRLAILAVQQGKDKSEVQALLEQAWQLAQSSSDQRALA